MIEKRGTGIIIQNEKGQFLLHLRDENAPVLKSQWCMIGGNIEKGEDIEQTIKREVKEESNLDIKSLRFIKKIPFNNKEISVFFAKVGNSENMKLGEGKKLQFFDKEDLIKLVDNLDYSNIYLKTYKEFVKLLKNQ